MKFQTTNGEVYAAVEALLKLASCSMPITLAVRLARMTGKLRLDAVEIENGRLKLIEQYVMRDGHGNQVPELDGNQQPLPNRVRLEDPAGFNAAVAELFAAPLEVDVEPLTTADLELMSGNVTPASIFALGQFLYDQTTNGNGQQSVAAGMRPRNGGKRPAPRRARGR